VEGTVGVPEGSILSIRAGQMRKQGSINTKKGMKFGTGKADANPFVVDLYTPVASKRLTLVPRSDRYAVNFGSGEAAMQVNLKILESSNLKEELPGRTPSQQQRRDRQKADCQDYVENHKLVQFMQNLMQSILVERPDDPFIYMESHLRAAKGATAGPRAPPKLDTAIPPSPVALQKKATGPLKEAMAPQPKTFSGPAFALQDQSGTVTTVRPLKMVDFVAEGSNLRRLRLRNLSEVFSSRKEDTPLRGMTSRFMGGGSWVSEVFFSQSTPKNYYQMLCAGPRETLHFKPNDVVATIVTCGGLCPGLNSVVRQVVQMLGIYGVRKIFGIRGGYKGVVDPNNWVELTPEAVQDIHDLGGTVLASDRGNPPVEEQAAALKAQGVRQHFVIGGDGTHRGAYGTYEAMQKLGWECAVVGIPKTIDNDVPMLDRTFGFDTACTEAVKAIQSAYTEATCNANCIGLVKLMGRHCGFIAMNACLAARYVDICLLPEMEISAEKVLQQCINLMQTKGYAVIVVAEGCGGTLIQGSGEKDAGGNVKLADVGPWLRDKILERFKQVKLPLTIKYIDPTYMIRAVKPNANDSVYCAVLADNAVHAAMAGYTGVTIGKVCERYVMLPIQAITHQKSKRVDLGGRFFVRLMSTTMQPDLSANGYQNAITDEGATDPLVEFSDPVDFETMLGGSDELRRLELEHLGSKFGVKDIPTTLHETIQGANLGFMDKDTWVTQTLGTRSSKEIHVNLQMLRAGPRRVLHFKPKDVAAAIVTCGGLCPGLNSVIRELVMMLYAYGVKKVYGIKGGFKGAVKPSTWMTLTPENVRDIHTLGGTILVSDRGNPTEEEMANALRAKGVRQYFVVGGDGTHRGAYKTYEAMSKINWECAVIGVPKTIDNDIALLDQTFGFDSACSEALKAINTAYVEATCNANCIGLVKLMGRHCGYLAMMSVLAARYVDICLLPEMDVSLDKVLEHCAHLVNTQGYAVVVVAEGCGDTLIQSSGETDAGGNKKLGDAGLWLKEQILDHFKTLKLPLTIKYVDPTYMVRAVPANANDSIYCSLLSHSAVHAAMAGYTGVTVAKVSEAFVWLPIGTITGTPNRKVDVTGHWYERMLATTLQPNLAVGISTAKPALPCATPAWSRRKTYMLTSDEDSVRVPDVTLTIVDGYGEPVTSRPLERSDLLAAGAQIRLLKCFHLGDRFGNFSIPSPLKARLTGQFQDIYSWVAQSTITRDRDGGKTEPYYQMLRAGPRERLHFDPNDPVSCAAIVSCGGICPGLNSVIREIVNTLWDYGVRRIYGIKGGYKGVVEPDKWVQLTPETVRDIHTQGGTMLISDRGNPEIADMAQVLKEQGVRQYFVLGGDGTHKGAMKTFEGCLEIDHECSVIGVPKTIDNDVPLLDQTFGFDTACTEALKAVDSAYVEATCNANCIGLVKLMGRHCGFIAMHATLASRHVDICLLPEMNIDSEKVLEHTAHLMRTKKHCVIVVAEGCGDTLIKSSGAVDAGGNKVLADAGLWLKGAIAKRLKELGITNTIKYIDPTYMIRSTPANAFDSQYCATLAQNAVHGALAGYSGVTVGKVHERFVFLPIHAITGQAGRRVDPQGRWFRRMLETTKQPDFLPDGSQHSPKKIDSAALESLSSPGSVNLLLNPGDEVRRLELVQLSETFRPANIKNPCLGIDGKDLKRDFLDASSWATKTFMRTNKRDDRGHVYYQMLLGGPREHLHFNPADCKAVIVTCGGLCPGLNSVIREIVMTLTAYGVTNVFGCKGGYKGMTSPSDWIQLTPEVVKDIHNRGGTILVSDRGNPPCMDVAKILQEQKVTHYFVIGGDGTHRGAMEIFRCTQEVNHNVSVVGVPKTIDNDIPILDRSFGYKTACTEAVKAINSAYTEATSNTNCIGLVKLMGRHCGWIAMEATLAARHVDICIIPEMDVSLPKLLAQALNLIKTQGFAVIVVAEGCGDTLIQSSGERDAGGNKKLADVGPWLQGQLLDFFRPRHVPLTVKFIDPTYTIRAVPANANDSIYCSVLAQHAVHGAMAGYSGITVGKVDERYVMLPIHAITCMEGSRKVDLQSRNFRRLISTTCQPNLSSGAGDDWALLPPIPSSPPAEEISDEAAPEMGIFEWKGTSAAAAAGAVLPAAGDVTGSTLRVLSGYGQSELERTLQAEDIVDTGSQFRRLEVMRLSDRFGPGAKAVTPLKIATGFLDDDSWAVETTSLTEGGLGKSQAYFQLLRAGPREHLYFDPKDSAGCAAIVTCGGLSPGENAAIREITHTLNRYGVQHIYGIMNGFHGILDREGWMELTPDSVQNIHQRGGTILKSRRGNPNHTSAAAALKAAGVRQLFALGGDGTLRGVLQIFTALSEINHECACIGIPATINNDIPLVDRTFGFDTACTVSRDSLSAAYVEATCNANCIGMVKLAGLHSGFLALEATLASRNVDICLLPEMDISLEKVLDHCETLMGTKGYAVVAVADGCRSSLFKNLPDSETLDVGTWLRDQVLARFKEKKKPLTIKYIDPTYTVRSEKANEFDSVYGSVLAEHAVHGAMAGYTGVCVGKVNERNVYMPLQVFSKVPRRTVDLTSRWFARMLFNTRQPVLEVDSTTHVPCKDRALLTELSTPVALQDLLRDGTEVKRMKCASLGDTFSSKAVDNPLKSTVLASGDIFLQGDAWSMQTLVRHHASDTTGRSYLQLLKAGPRDKLHFDPSEPGMCAAIVTCGGLCPGLNSVIRELVMMLNSYGVKTVYGVIGGYRGFTREDEWVQLTPESVQDIHTLGGSILVSDRGNPPHSEIAAVLKRRNIRQYFVLGGDGTHQGAMSTFEETTKISHECAVVGVPKTIDNDIQILDRSFGFDSACAEAELAIDSAYVEASTNANCIGLVKLMGRHCGWIAATATLAARHVDVVLLPEMSISLPKLLDYVAEVMKKKKSAVIVVAEGCGDTIISSTGETDAGGNKQLADVGPYLKDEITKHCKSLSIPLTIKYIDPTYMIRSVPANAYDSKYCSSLAQGAVNAAMAGYTGITVGKVDDRYVMLPIHAITSQGPRKVELKSRFFERVMATTKQPSFEP